MAKTLLITCAIATVCLASFFAGWQFRDPHDERPATAGPFDAEADQSDRLSAEAARRRIEQLETQQNILRQQVAEQRQTIRDHALTPPARSVDEMLALFPARFPKGNWMPAGAAYEECWFEATDGVRLHGWYFRHPSPTAVVLYVHGNAGNITHRAPVAAMLRDRLGASLLVFDYRGYGRSEGVPTIDGILCDARAARDYLCLREELAPAQIVLMGRSLGGAVAVQLAAAGGARTLVLESTFSSLKEAATSHYPELLVNVLVADRLDSVSAIPQYHGPLLQSHGDADRTIPFALGQELFQSANDPKTFIRIPGADHNDMQTETYYRQLESFFKALPDLKT